MKLYQNVIKLEELSEEQYGSYDENPAGYSMVQTAIEHFGQPSAKNILYGMDSDGNAIEFLTTLGYDPDNDEGIGYGDCVDEWIKLGFVLLSEDDHNSYFIKNNMMIIGNNYKNKEDDGSPNMLIVNIKQ